MDIEKIFSFIHFLVTCSTKSRLPGLPHFYRYLSDIPYILAIWAILKFYIFTTIYNGPTKSSLNTGVGIIPFISTLTKFNVLNSRKYNSVMNNKNLMNKAKATRDNELSNTLVE